MTTIKINGAAVDAAELHHNIYTAECLSELRYALQVGLVDLEITLEDGSVVCLLDLYNRRHNGPDIDAIIDDIIDDYINKTYDSDDDYRRRNGIE